MILRYDTADKKTILPSIPILKTLGATKQYDHISVLQIPLQFIIP
jgi:hypothetical protein